MGRLIDPELGGQQLDMELVDRAPVDRVYLTAEASEVLTLKKALSCEAALDPLDGWSELSLVAYFAPMRPDPSVDRKRL